MNAEFMDYIRKSIEANEHAVKEMAMKKKQQKTMELLEKSGLGKRFSKRTFETFNIKDLTLELLDAYHIAHGFAINFPKVRKGLLFTGPVGTGKTHLAAAVGNFLIDKLYSVAFGNATDIVTLIKSTYRKDSEMTEEKVIRAFTDETDIFIIDDLGKEYSSPNTSAVLYQIINRLYENEKPIIVTTNFSSSALRRKLGERGEATMSRLTEMCEFVKVSGPDWRLKVVEKE